MAADTFATVEDLEARFRALDEYEAARAAVLLEDAATLLRAEFATAGRAIDGEDTAQASALKVVSCAMVKRILASGVEGDYTQMSQTEGPFTQSYTFSNPSGDMYIRTEERRLLGIPKKVQRVGYLGV